jgi:hypothetical protein
LRDPHQHNSAADTKVSDGAHAFGRHAIESSRSGVRLLAAASLIGAAIFAAVTIGAFIFA